MIRLKSSKLHRYDLRTRLPFRYGIVTMTALPHVFLTVEAEIGGATVQGIAADHLPPKWFTKDPDRDPAEEIQDMWAVIQQAAKLAETIESKNLFSWWWKLFKAQEAWTQSAGHEPLLAHFGTSLVERAVVDAACRHRKQPLHKLIKSPETGVDWTLCQPQLAGEDWLQFLPQAPLESARVRHTVGMVDPLRESDIAPEDRLDDGLPQSLEACIQFYGLSDFKLKLSGQADADLTRLSRIAQVIREKCEGDYLFSLDANEQFSSPGQLNAFAQQVYSENVLNDFFEHLLLIEQPLSRKVALAQEQTDVRACWSRRVPIIIDESDGGWHDLPRALELGYAGVSHKNCKGLFKGLRNKCLVQKNKRDRPEDRPWVTSAEDLANIGPVALLQDLAMQAALGNESIERNGHHYFAGLSMFPESFAKDSLTHHSDIYTVDEKSGARLNIKSGHISLGSVNQAPFGIAKIPDLEALSK